tara:strand:- start:63 stop:509 length:447 start_codon:yes stop_codon:yes gene_type:complete
MPKVKVWNDNVHPHTETFKGDVIHIPAKTCIEMEWEEAIEFKGQFTGMKRRGDDSPDPTGFKMIRVEKPSEPIFKEPPLVNHANGQVVLTKAELMESLAQYAHLRAPSDPLAEAGITSPSNADLIERIAALEEALAASGKPRRAKKED